MAKKLVSEQRRKTCAVLPKKKWLVVSELIWSIRRQTRGSIQLTKKNLSRTLSASLRQLVIALNTHQQQRSCFTNFHQDLDKKKIWTKKSTWTKKRSYTPVREEQLVAHHTKVVFKEWTISPGYSVGKIVFFFHKKRFKRLKRFKHV